MKIYIKNMVCQGTRFFVIQELDRLGLNCKIFESGEIDFEEDLSLTEIKKVDQSLRKYGLDFTFGESKLVSEIQHTILNLVYNNITPGTSLSFYISNKVGYNYTYLHEYFRKEKGISIKEYYLEKKYEKVRLNEPSKSDVFDSDCKSA